MHVSEMAAIHLLRSHTPLLNSSKFKLLRPSLNSFIIYNQHDQNPNFSRHFRPIHSITPKSFKSVGNNWEEGPNNQHHQHNQHYQNQPWKRTRVGSNGEEGSENWARKGRLETCVGSNGEAGSNSFSVSKNEISENKMKFSGSLEHNAPVHPITPKSFPESPLVDVNGTFEEPISEPSARGWSNFCSPQSNPTNSIKAVGSSEEEELGIRVNLSLVSEKETSENMMESPPLPEQMVGHNAPVHPITPKSFPESPQSTSTNSIKGVGSRREEGSKIRVNLSPNLAESVVLTDSVAGGKKGKNKMCWVCVNCGHSEAQWWGTCKSCNKVGSLKQFLVSENETSEDEFPVWEAPEDKFSGWEASEDTVKSSFLPELMVGHNAPVHPITPKSFPESPLTDVNGASEEPISEPSARGFWSISRFPQSNPTNSITGVSSSEEKGSRIRMNMLENESSENMMESSSLPEQMVGHNAPVHPIIPKSCPESSQSTPTNSIKGVGSRGEEGSKIRVNLSPNVEKGVVLGDFLPGGKKGKSKMYWLCVDCGHSQTQWWGTCKSCNKFGTLKQFSVPENETFGSMMKASWLREQMIGQNKPVRLVDVNRGINHMEWRIRLSGLLGLEVNRVLGGGILPGSLILVGGDPGVGKSTLALQMAALVAVSGDVGGEAPVLYISGEESVEQIGNRADRLSIDTEELFLYSSTDIEDILEKVQVLSPRAVIVDSIQTMYLKGVTGSPGGMSQVKECTSALLRFAKKTNIPILLIGQVNKSGEIAGPRVLEHIVDVVLYMEGDKHSSHRLLRSVKNRFGSTDELGVVAMSESGLEPVSNPSEMFLSEEYLNSDHLVGLAIAVIIDGSRSFLIEVQALCVSGTGSTRHVNGVQLSRADMILSVLKKQAGLKLDDHSIFLNIISGGTLAETSGDLAVAAAICSSFLEFALPNDIAFIGEIGLGGELRMVPRIEKRVATLAKLGYKKCVVPALAVKALAAIKSEIKIVGCKNFKQVLDKVFSRED